MRLTDIANVVPGATVTTKNPIRDAIRSRRTADLKAALLQDKRNKDTVPNEPDTKIGYDGVDDPGAKVV